MKRKLDSVDSFTSLENNMEEEKKILNDNFKNNTKGDKNLYKDIPTSENILNKDTWQQLLRKKKNTAPGAGNISYEIKKKKNINAES